MTAALPDRAVVAVYAAAAAVTVAALGRVAWHGLAEPGIALAFGIFIAVGELARWGTRPGPGALPSAPPGAPPPLLEEPSAREPAPLGAAGALAYALLGECAGRATGHGPLQVVAVVVAGVLTGAVPHVARGRGPGLDHVARRVLTAGFAAVCFQPLHHSGAWDHRIGHGPLHALFLLVLLVLTLLCDAVLASVLLAARTRYPDGPLLRDELRALPGTGSAVCATGAVMAPAVAVAGLWALPVFCVPLLLTQLSFRRYASVRATYRQTIASLARATEIAGYTPPGHARRVAVLSTAVGREMRLSGPELSVLEHAALMHDIGQLSLLDPVPNGATAVLPAAEQRRIALLGGAVVRRTGVPAAVAAVVEQQADPYREQSLPARIVRTVNAYEDLAQASGGSAGGALAALERLRLGTGHDYEPAVVESLARVLARGGLTRVPPG
ncbi:metal-dependent phosphohydrolase [Streptomyces sp. ISL-10]|uniref:HDOD domain-containing protein n=1 Tax=Streptomyces sp. ISL-10 TaxID=2819172 RepID=UPI001BEA6FC5|nr:HDOD domain-containing protein [Streptomyces sp. ISL-10]MBT2365288.1 metal-dependent phosphohydrolase [Streptomyces sp. ISL-10]